MPDPKIHALNVRQGDCYIIERPSGRVTMIDICCGNLEVEAISEAKLAALERVKPKGNFGMGERPTNPIDYLTDKGIGNIFRFILTHPDMDHMDGIERLFTEKTVCNFWDCGVRRDKPNFEQGSPYREEDWDFYADLVAGQVADTTIVTPRAGSNGMYWSADNAEGTGDGDYISVVAPNDALVKHANDGGDINDGSYVIVYRSSAGRIVFPGDSNDATWAYIIKNHSNLVKDAAVLFAPHHGRKSDRDYSFLDVVKPKVSFFGCAPSEHLAYSAWDYRNLLYFTSNQCGNVHVYPNGKAVDVFIENQKYADAYTSNSTYQKDGYWFLCSV